MCAIPNADPMYQIVRRAKIMESGEKHILEDEFRLPG